MWSFCDSFFSTQNDFLKVTHVCVSLLPFYGLVIFYILFIHQAVDIDSAIPEVILLHIFLICKLKGWHCHTSQFCATCSNHLNETVGYILTSDVDKNHRILELEKKLSIYSNSLIVKLEKLKQILFEYSVFSFKYFIIFYGKTYQLNGNYP